jgi:hypothetical protein
MFVKFLKGSVHSIYVKKSIRFVQGKQVERYKVIMMIEKLRRMQAYQAKKLITILILFCCTLSATAENGHELWLRKHKSNPVTVLCKQQSPALNIAIQELQQGWLGKAGATFSLIIKNSPVIKGDGYELTASGIQANTDLGILYGVYDLLRRQQTGESTENIISNPSYQRRMVPLNEAMQVIPSFGVPEPIH